MDDKHTRAYESPSPREPETIEYEWNEGVSPTTAVVEVIAAVTNQNPRHLPPLYEYVDVDSLDDVITTGTKDTERTVSLSFPYEEHTVCVESDGTIQVELGTVEDE